MNVSVMKNMIKGVKLIGPLASYLLECRTAAQHTMPITLEQNVITKKEEQNPYGYGHKYNEYMSLARITLR